MKHFPIFILTFILLFSSCQNNSPTAEPSRESLQEAVEQFNQYFKEGNVDGLASMTSENYSHTTGTNKTINKETWIGYMNSRTQEMKDGELEVNVYDFEDGAYHVFGNSGVVTGKTIINSNQNEREIFIEYRITMFWVMENGKWKRTAVHYAQIDRNYVGFRVEKTFLTKDSVKVYADVYEYDKSAPTLLLFHQAGANARGEYDPIIPRILSEGFNIVAIDQRTGGQYFGSYNRTVEGEKGKQFSYCEAFPDFIAAIEFVRSEGYLGKLVVWGSSYSAALVIKLANELPSEIAGVMAFSPASGDPMENCQPNDILKTIKTPLLLLRPASEMGFESVKTQFEIAKEAGHETFVAENGVHGSSMLVEERTGQDVSATWDRVLSFIKKFK